MYCIAAESDTMHAFYATAYTTIGMKFTSCNLYRFKFMRINWKSISYD